MLEAFFSGKHIGEKVGTSIRYRGFMTALRVPEPDELIVRNGNVFIDAAKSTGFIVGFMYTGADALLYPDVIVTPDPPARQSDRQS